MNIDNKELALFWYYNIKDTFPQEDIDSNADLKEQYVFIKNHFLHSFLSSSILIHSMRLKNVYILIAAMYLGYSMKRHFEKMASVRVIPYHPGMEIARTENFQYHTHSWALVQII